MKCLMFGSSNFLWENLEKIASCIKYFEEAGQLTNNSITTVTGHTPSFFHYHSTKQFLFSNPDVVFFADSAGSFRLNRLYITLMLIESGKKVLTSKVK